MKGADKPPTEAEIKKANEDMQAINQTLKCIRSLHANFNHNNKYEEMKRRKELQKLRILQKLPKVVPEQPKQAMNPPTVREPKRSKPKAGRPPAPALRKFADVTTPSSGSSDESEDEKNSVKLYYTVSTSVKESDLGLKDPLKSNPVVMATLSQYSEEERIRADIKKLINDNQQANARVVELAQQEKAFNATLVSLKAKYATSLARSKETDNQILQVSAKVDANSVILENQQVKRESIRRDVESESLTKLEILNRQIADMRLALSNASKKYTEGEKVLEYEVNMNSIRTDFFNTQKTDLKKIKAEVGPANSIEDCKQSNKRKTQAVIDLINSHLKVLSQEETDLVQIMATFKKGRDVKPLLANNNALKEKIIAHVYKNID